MPLNQTVQSNVGLYAGKRYNGQLDTLQIGNVTDAILTTSPVLFGGLLARDGLNVKPFVGETDEFVGIALRKHTVMNAYDASTVTEYVVGDSVAFANFGYVVVEVEDAVVKGGTVFARFVAGAGGTVLGAIRGDADTDSAVAISGVVFAESASAGEMVRVAITRIFE